MKIETILPGGNERLILFFNGWGAPPSVVAHLCTGDPGTCVKVCYDYTDPAFPADLSAYREIHLVAWSLGVWAAQSVLRNIPLASATAINGTPYPVHDVWGIPVNIFEGTIDHLSEDTFLRFTRRMCGSAGVWKEYRKLKNTRSVESLKEELRAIRKRYEEARDETVSFPWSRAILSTADAIFPFTSLCNYWATRVSGLTYIDAPHYPFYLWNEWKQIGW
ncbi:DUF452 family protein [Parabacteroides pacaensis]|uniref:DUF452 family protein n=1 Tax=Parabacteroides pacaensis TaxID=2086575 RepID=UPI000D103457|nr:pimeloyl-ACP methyl esterase BioG family protein [Parabacteroides pacaensis]